MSFEHLEYFPVIILGIVIFSILVFKTNARFFQWVEDHWFFKESYRHKISTILYLIGVSLLLLGLLDLRGPEKRITGKVSEQKTIILIDNSASMLAEDVRPNRFEKALLLAKHFVKNAVGHKISLSVFSDGVKKIVPFTDDYNLIDARIDSLKNLDLRRGGTNLAFAIKESVQNFITANGEAEGNILVFTDGEENDEGIALNLPKGISVVMVGVGTAKGAPIPLRNNRGVLTGNKRHKGKVVISKLNEKYFKSLDENIKNYNYWIATSYSLPTTRILNFFNKIHDVKNSQNDFRIKPVYAQYLLVPAVIFLALSFILGRRIIFVMVITLMFSLVSFAQNKTPLPVPAMEADEPVKSEKTLELEEKFAGGNLDREGKLALASSLLKDNFPEQSAALYEEVLKDNISGETAPHQFNYATSLLKSNKVPQAINKYKEIMDYNKANPSKSAEDMNDMIKKNILKVLKQQQSKKGKSKSDDQSENKEDSQKSEGQEGNKEGEQKDKKDKQDSKDGKEKENKKESSGKDEKDKKRESTKESEKEKKERRKKLPAQLKQLMNNDNQLQKKMIDAKTTKRKAGGTKDW